METQTLVPQAKDGAVRTRRSIISSLSPATRWALLSCAVLAIAFGFTGLILSFYSYGFFTALIACLVFFAAVMIFAILATLIFAALKKLRWQVVFVIFAALFLCALANIALLYILPLLISCLTAVYFAVMCGTGRYKALGKFKKILRYCLLGLFGILALCTFALTLWQGPSINETDRPGRALLALPYADKLQNNAAPVLDNPSLPGGYNYSVLYYAYPEQRIDPYPGQDAIFAAAADASELIGGWNSIRESMLGFGPDALPLNAQVWMPEGDGPFPLTLILHGNHESGDRSDGGYTYLGELLASRGIIAVSVDENFLNYSMLYDVTVFAGLEQENDARAFVLLEHLCQWHEWNAEPSHLFYGKVDFDNVALIGHSRGGEAVALAAAFAELDYYPDNGRVIFDYPFRIKTVVAIAPVHRQYDPAGLEVSIANVNYLVLHGSHDMDVISFMGANMYSRADVSEYGVKARVLMQYANHGQFNTSWGNVDLPGLGSLVINRNLLISQEEQQQAAKVFICAFLESTLHGKEEYNTLFRDFANGADWLPPVLYITDYIDSAAVLIDSFDSGFNLQASTSGLAQYSSQGFDTWTQAGLPGKIDNSNRVLTLKWGSEEYTEKYGSQTPTFKIGFMAGTVSVGDRLYISLCSGKENADEPDVSFEIKLTDSAGNTSIMSINDFGGVINPIEAPVFKPLISAIVGVCEPVLQMVCIPTERFEGLRGDIFSMEWIMDAGEAGKTGQVLYADDLRVERCDLLSAAKNY